MVKMYIIASSFLPELSHAFNTYRKQETKLFKVLGTSTGLEAIKSLSHAGQEFQSDVVLFITTDFISQKSTLLEIAKKYPNKSFLVITPLNYSSHELQLEANVYIMESISYNQPIQLNQLISKVADIIKISIDRPRVRNKKSIKQKKLVYSNGTIGVMGSHERVGTTHAAIMLATYLAKFKKVALIEGHDHGDFKELFPHKRKSTDMQRGTIKGVHYYWNMDLIKFWTTVREDYDVVVIDYGSYEDIVDFEDFLRVDKKIVIVDGIDWRIPQLKRFYKTIASYDSRRQWVYLVPFLTKKYLKDLQELIDNPVYSIPYQMNPFQIQDKLEKIMVKLLG